MGLFSRNKDNDELSAINESNLIDDADDIYELFIIPDELSGNMTYIAVESEEQSSEIAVNWKVDIFITKDKKGKPEVKSVLRQFYQVAEKYNIAIDETYVSLEDIQEVMTGELSKDSKKIKEDLETRTKMQKMAKELFTNAAQQGASDVHIVVEEKVAKIHLRVHGLLKEESQLDNDFAEQFISTVYTTMCDVSDSYFNKTRPQNARISDPNYLPKSVFGVRMATAIQTEGLYCVFRLLYQQQDIENLSVTQLGYNPEQVDQIEKMKQKPTGINIIVGATGSGKSTTLQLVLTSIIKKTKGQKNVLTVEDPPEYPIVGAKQIPVANANNEAERKDKFNQAITAAMRLDPDIIMLGEMRDTASASLGVRAAMTGHQVWSTLHANSVFGALDRLADYDISLDILGDPMILTGIIYQTLVQTLCEGCMIPYSQIDFTKEENLFKLSSVERMEKILENDYSKEDIHNKLHFRGAGCEKCNGGPPGIKGRSVVAEVLYPDEKVLELIRKKQKEDARRYWLKELEGRPVAYEAVFKCLEGNVDPEMAEDKVGFFFDPRTIIEA